MSQAVRSVRPESLSGWKEISSYMEISPRTAQLWEKKFGMPVRRIGGNRGAVHASVAELDAWRRSRTESGEHEAAKDASPPTLPVVEAPPTRQGPRKGAAYLAATAAVVVLGAVGWSVRPEPKFEPSSPDHSVDLPKVTADPNWVKLSPTGDRAAVTGYEAGSDWTSLIVVDTVRGETKSLVPQGVALSPVAWSPDGERLAYLGHSTGLSVIPAAGGEPTSITHLPGKGVSGMDWRADGKTLLVSLLSVGILEVDVASGSIVPLLNHPHAEDAQYIEHQGRPAVLFSSEEGNPEGLVSHVAPHQVSLLSLESGIVEELFTVAQTLPNVSYHPDGYVLHSAGTPEQPRVVATPILASGAPPARKPIVIAEGGYAPSVTPDGSLAMLGGRGFPLALTWVNRAGESLGTMGKQFLWLERPRISPSGKHAVVYGTDGMATSFWLADPDGASELNASPFRFSMSAWRRDEQMVAHEGRVDGVLSIRFVDVDRPNEGRAIPSYGFIPDNWSMDGKTLLGSKEVDGMWQLWLLPVDGSGMGERALRAPGHHFDGRWSPDGRWMSYGRIHDGKRHVFVRAADASVTDPGVVVARGRQARWTKNGTELVYEREGVLYAVPIAVEDGRIVAGTPDQERFQLPEGTHKTMFEVAPDGERLLVARPATPDPRPFRIDVWSKVRLP